MSHSPYPLGKLPANHLAQMLKQYSHAGGRVVVGPGIGHDSAVIRIGDQYLAAKTDPITFASDEIGWYAVHVNANDIACTGATPCWFLATLLLPHRDTGPSLVNTIFSQIAAACAELDVVLVGGHTEITHGIDRPLVVGCMLGDMAPEQLVRPDGAQVGDAVILTKGIAVEGTAIIAREKHTRLTGLDPAWLRRCQSFLHAPGISVVRDASVATSAGSVHAMHDPTEGGLATGLIELAASAGVGLQIDEAAIPILPETKLLCGHLGLDPLGLIASGALLMAVATEDCSRILAALGREDIAAAEIGSVVSPDFGTVLRGPQGERPIPRFERDEIAKFFE